LNKELYIENKICRFISQYYNGKYDTEIVFSEIEVAIFCSDIYGSICFIKDIEYDSPTVFENAIKFVQIRRGTGFLDVNSDTVEFNFNEMLNIVTEYYKENCYKGLE
jgi:hypothetical protein